MLYYMTLNTYINILTANNIPTFTILKYKVPIIRSIYEQIGNI